MSRDPLTPSLTPNFNRLNQLILRLRFIRLNISRAGQKHPSFEFILHSFALFPPASAKNKRGCREDLHRPPPATCNPPSITNVLLSRCTVCNRLQHCYIVIHVLVEFLITVFAAQPPPTAHPSPSSTVIIGGIKGIQIPTQLPFKKRKRFQHNYLVELCPRLNPYIFVLMH
jgi:hypothetical protein